MRNFSTRRKGSVTGNMVTYIRLEVYSQDAVGPPTLTTPEKIIKSRYCVGRYLLSSGVCGRKVLVAVDSRSLSKDLLKSQTSM